MIGQLAEIVKEHHSHFSNVLPFALQPDNVLWLDLSAGNQELAGLETIDNLVLAEYIQKSLKKSHAEVAMGGYLEDRLIYRKSKHFGVGEQARSIHLGLDIWLDEYTPIHAPLNGEIHSFQNNNNFGDYGPTIILEHTLDEVVFYSLYGHLSEKSLQNISLGQQICAGEAFAEVGCENENGHWPPHLHLQLISDMGEYKGDFPGVCNKLDLPVYQSICLDPKLLLTV